MINIKAMGLLKHQVAPDTDGSLCADFFDGMTVADVTGSLGLEEPGRSFIIIVNETRRPAGHRLCDGDNIIIMPIIAGG